jgi:fibronectin type 3 domain-containing protein
MREMWAQLAGFPRSETGFEVACVLALQSFFEEPPMRLSAVVLGCALVACSSTPATPPQPPAAPTGLSATGGVGQISLAWTAVAGATSYNVLRAEAAGAETQLATSGAAAYTDGSLAAGKTYFYVVQAVNAAGKSGNSNEASATTVPPGPTGLVATGGVGQIALAWTAVAGASGYSVQRGDAAGGPYTEVATPSAAAYTDTTVAAGTTYYYVVQAVTAQGHTANSAEASAVTAPPAPTGLSVTGTADSLTVHWDAAPGATSYDVSRQGGASLGNTTQTSLTETGLAGNTTATYVVRAKNASGSSGNSDPVSGTTAPAPPTGITASASNHHVTLGWTGAAGATGYRVLRGTSPAGPFTSAGTTSTTSFTDIFLDNGVAYSFVVHSMNDSSEGDDSDTATATPFLDLCVTDGAAYTVSVFDGSSGGDVAPLRRFGWDTGTIGGSGIAADGTNIYLASTATHAINVYDRLDDGHAAPSRSIATSASGPVSLAIDTANKLLYTLEGSNVVTYSTDAAISGAQSSFAAGAGALALALDTAHSELFVVTSSLIKVFSTSGTLSRTINPRVAASGAAIAPPNLIAPTVAYDPTADTIFIGWGDGSAASITSYARTASGATDPATLINGSNFIQVSGLMVDINKTALWISGLFAPHGGNTQNEWAIKGVPRTTNGSNPATRALFDGIFLPGAIALDAGNQEFFAVNANGLGAVAYDELPASGSSPKRNINDAGTGIFQPSLLAADRTGDEIVVLNDFPAFTLSVYPRTQDSGSSLAPSRSLNITANSPLNNLAVDDDDGWYWISEGFSVLFAFDRGLASVTPVRDIEGDNTLLYAINGLAWDTRNQQLVVNNTSLADTNDVRLFAWDHTANGDVAPLRNATGATFTTNLVADAVNDELFAGGATTTVYPLSFGSGALTATRTAVFGSGPIAVDGEGEEVFVPAGDRIDVFSRTATGTPAPKRSFTGANTKLYGAVGVAICN